MRTIYPQNRNTREKGFTLVELMVSLTIFSIVMLISTGTLLILIDINAKAQAIYSATTNLTFALDNMTREIRTGYHYNCMLVTNPGPTDPLPVQTNTNDCPSGNYIAFTREKDGSQVAYRLNGSKIESKRVGSSWLPLTSDDVVIDTFQLVVSGTATQEANNTVQPTVEFLVKGHVNNGLDTDTDFVIQSRVVQRRLDII
jgi:prepilin-type N-terminal cleavage/methylation domain-containing protein